MASRNAARPNPRAKIPANDSAVLPNRAVLGVTPAATAASIPRTTPMTAPARSLALVLASNLSATSGLPYSIASATAKSFIAVTFFRKFYESAAITRSSAVANAADDAVAVPNSASSDTETGSSLRVAPTTLFLASPAPSAAAGRTSPAPSPSSSIGTASTTMYGFTCRTRSTLNLDMPLA
eukprot:8694-Pelagococcus_subviridis.AAC.12